MAEAKVLADLATHLQTLATGQVSSVSIKLPEFWTKSPEVWFARVEAQFGTRKITEDQTKYDYVVSALDVNTAEEVQDILTNPPHSDRYVTLKSVLIKVYGKSQARKDAEILNLSGLGDMLPTALLRRINALNNDPQTLKRALFLSNLPVEVRGILAAQNVTDIDDLAEAADRVCEVRQHGVQEVSQLPVGDVVSRAAVPLQTVVDSQEEIPIAAAFRHKHIRKRSFSGTSTSSICYYHTRFGPQAISCRPGCKFSCLLSKSGGQPSGNERSGR